MPTEFELACRKTAGVTEVLPGKLEHKARAELIKACGTISLKARAKARDLEHVARGELGMISKETIKQLKGLAKDMGKKHRTKMPKFKMKDVQKPTKGSGKQVRLKMPVKFAGGLDVHLLLNFDDDKIWDAEFDVVGGGVGLSRNIGDRTKVDARIFVDTSEVKTSHAGSVLVTVTF